ncbi:hypothetical protein TSUD_187050 [Trifolium subterraneum]|uniref:Uncharacterized protein n=1 Tax=Trifolium subterraneum TaxID=3900 RepID=A0A2Z6N7X9_TRISU|nr:hypothetical protein TSUD_187050 [Trifolium subterraneum]
MVVVRRWWFSRWFLGSERVVSGFETVVMVARRVWELSEESSERLRWVTKVMD